MQLVDAASSRKDLPWRLGRILLLALGGTLVIWLCLRFAEIILAWSLYSRFVEKIREVGGLPDFLSGAIAVWCVVVVILFVPTLTFSIFIRRSRKMIFTSAVAFSVWMVFLYGLSLQQSKNLFNPMTGRANYNYAKDPTGKVKIFSRDYSYDPETGRRLKPLTDDVADAYRRQVAEETLLKDQLAAALQTREESRRSLETTQAAYASLKQKYEKQAEELEGAKAAATLPSPASQPTTVPGQAENAQGPTIPPVQADDFLFKVNGCVRSMSRIRCSGTVTNTGPDPTRFYVRWDESFAVDSFGHQVTLTPQALVIGDGREKTLQPDLPIAFSVILDDDGVPTHTTELSVVLAITPNKFPLPLERPRIVSMRHIPILVRQP